MQSENTKDGVEKWGHRRPNGKENVPQGLPLGGKSGKMDWECRAARPNGLGAAVRGDQGRAHHELGGLRGLSEQHHDPPSQRDHIREWRRTGVDGAMGREIVASPSILRRVARQLQTRQHTVLCDSDEHHRLMGMCISLSQPWYVSLACGQREPVDRVATGPSAEVFFSDRKIRGARFCQNLRHQQQHRPRLNTLCTRGPHSRRQWTLLAYQTQRDAACV